MSTPRRSWTITLGASVLATLAGGAFAATTGYAPDAWMRGNTADSSHFGWDVLDRANKPSLGFGRVLDDSTPDIGVGITATGTRLFQGADGVADPSPTQYGHVSGSSNYYSGANITNPDDPQVHFANDTITGTAPASGSGGFTTVVLQVLGSDSNTVADLAFAMTTGGWTKQKNLYGIVPGATGPTGLFWQEWTAPGANLPFAIQMTSTLDSRGLDSFEVDTFWTSSRTPAVNARAAIGVPEPSVLYLAATLAAWAVRRRR